MVISRAMLLFPAPLGPTTIVRFEVSGRLNWLKDNTLDPASDVTRTSRDYPPCNPPMHAVERYRCCLMNRIFMPMLVLQTVGAVASTKRWPPIHVVRAAGGDCLVRHAEPQDGLDPVGGAERDGIPTVQPGLVPGSSWRA
jgi:hypothetical protein